jgi:probable O-glycosylation ligase (exosortase A-associated)
MRDLVIISLVFIGSVYALKQPWIGIMVWTWLSIMNPHRYAWGYAYDMPLAAITAACTLIGIMTYKEKQSPFKGSPVTILFLFVCWITISWLMGIDVGGDYYQWTKVMKIDAMIFVALIALRTKMHIFALTWTAVGSLALLGIKGGIFTITSGGNYRVWGPPGSFIEDNNELALALVMTIPLLRFLQLQLTNKWARHGITLSMILCAASALGSHSRGGFLAISAMTLFLWWRGKNKIATGFIIAIVACSLLLFMPAEWMGRMNSISSYEEDRSTLGRFSAWWTAWNLAWHYPFGVGFDAARPFLFALYSPYPDFVHAAHSIYFQILGNHGFIGLGLFLALWITTWRSAAWLTNNTPNIPETKWCKDLGNMARVCLAGYAVGGAFLSLAYFDFPYTVMAIVVLSRIWVNQRGWETDPPYVATGWRRIPGVESLPITANKQC